MLPSGESTAGTTVDRETEHWDMKRFICGIEYLFSRKRRECEKREFEEAQRAAQERLEESLADSQQFRPPRPTLRAKTGGEARSNQILIRDR